MINLVQSWWEGNPTGSRWRRRASALPADDGSCGWIETSPVYARLPVAPALSGEFEADAVVVGAGFTGLAAARRLAERLPGGRVVLLEAQRAGYGAAGRSSGFVVDLAHFVARMEPAHASAYVRLARSGIAELAQRVEEHAIDCAWDERGWLHVAASEEGARSLAMMRSWLEERGERFEALDRSAMQRLLGIGFYRAGIRLPGSVLVQPASLIAGLTAALPANVELYEGSPVRAVERSSGRLAVLAGEGSVATSRILLATNGCLAALGFAKRRVLPLFTYGSLTRPLTEEEQARLGGESEWGLLAEDAMGSTVRRTRDQRILIRNTVRYDGALAGRNHRRSAMAELHRIAFDARFEALAGLPFEHTWGGVMGVTRSRDVLFGQVADGVWAAGGYTGAGIAMGTACGALLAEEALESGSELLADVKSLPTPSWLPPAPILGIAARLKAWRMNASAGPQL